VARSQTKASCALFCAQGCDNRQVEHDALQMD
jgi:hypothetical protein